MSWLVIGGILYAWVFLTVLGGERCRRLQALRAEIEAEIAAQQQAEKSPAK